MNARPKAWVTSPQYVSPMLVWINWDLMTIKMGRAHHNSLATWKWHIYEHAGLAPSICWLYMKKGQLLLLGKPCPPFYGWSKPAGPVGPWIPRGSAKTLSLLHGWFISAQMHWDVAPVRTQHQLCRTERGHGCSAPWGELKITDLDTWPILPLMNFVLLLLTLGLLPIA